MWMRTLWAIGKCPLMSTPVVNFSLPYFPLRKAGFLIYVQYLSIPGLKIVYLLYFGLRNINKNGINSLSMLLILSGRKYYVRLFVCLINRIQ